MCWYKEIPPTTKPIPSSGHSKSKTATKDDDDDDDDGIDMELIKSSTNVNDSIASPVISRSDDASSVKHAEVTNDMSYHIV